MQTLYLNVVTTTSSPMKDIKLTGQNWWTQRESNPHLIVANELCCHYHYEPKPGAITKFSLGEDVPQGSVSVEIHHRFVSVLGMASENGGM